MRRDTVGLLGRILPLAVAVSRGVRTLGLVGLAAAAAIVIIVLVRWTPSDVGEWAGLALLFVLLALPPALLLAFSFVLGEVVELPDKLRSYPGTMRDHADELRAIAQDAQARERPAWRRLPGSTWRLATLVRSAPDLLAPHAPLVPLLNVPFLLATLVAALLVPVLVVAALVMLLAAAAAS
ncbi:MAG: hypothetical protein H0U90_00785 [Actinobacteria bacterium]|nr:hypothetical protein [Actinomycetota bacterium]